MKKVTRTLALLLILCTLLSCMSIFVSADSMISTEEMTVTCETVRSTQAVYESSLGKMETDEDNIKAAVETYLLISHASVVNQEKYDLTTTKCLVSTAKRNESIRYRLQANELQQKLNAAKKIQIVYDDLTTRDFEVKVDGNTATAKIVEDYSYKEAGSDATYGYTCEYTFTLNNSTGNWLIENIATNNPNEMNENFEYTFFDVDKQVELLTTAPSASLNSAAIAASKTEAAHIAAEEANAAKASLYKWTYSPSLGAAYAEKNYIYQSSSPFADNDDNGGNCQNFVSQCIFMGLGGSTSNIKAYPAVADSAYGSSNSRNWEHGQYYDNSSYYPGVQWAWDNCTGFSHYIDESSVYVEGPYGWVETGYLRFVSAGDVVWIDWEGNPVVSATSPTLDHAMYVTRVEGADVTRTMSQIYIAAHSRPTNGAYERLDNYIARMGSSATDSYFAQARIRGGHYAEPQS